MKPIYVGTIAKLGSVSFGLKDPSPGDRAKLYACMGACQPYDVGKRVYRVGDIFQVENTAQYNARIAKEVSANKCL